MTQFEEWPVYQQVKSTSCLPRSLNPCSACHCDSCQMFDAPLVFLPAAAGRVGCSEQIISAPFYPWPGYSDTARSCRLGCPGVGWTAGRCG